MVTPVAHPPGGSIPALRLGVRSPPTSALRTDRRTDLRSLVRVLRVKRAGVGGSSAHINVVKLRSGGFRCGGVGVLDGNGGNDSLGGCVGINHVLMYAHAYM